MLIRSSFPSRNLSCFLPRLFLLISLFLMASGIYIDPSSSFGALLSPQQHLEKTEENLAGPSQELARLLQAHLPRPPDASSLILTNYPEDRAVREALLAHVAQWHTDLHTNQPYYRTSNAFSVYLASANTPASLAELQIEGVHQPESTLLTARILLGLWTSRRDDAQLSSNGRVFIHPDEILVWRGVQKHRRQAYQGSWKKFSDGYPWKLRQQVQQDLAQLSRFHLRGQHVLVSQGKTWPVAIDAPYLSVTPVEKQGKIAGYLVAPGDWISSYEAHHLSFLASATGRLFHLNPRNDYLALRLGFYLVEHWRRHAHTSDDNRPFCMVRLLSASMIPIDKANLTSRFIPRVEAALHTLHTIGLLGEPPRNLSGVDITKAHWGKEWLASSWQLVPAQD